MLAARIVAPGEMVVERVPDPEPGPDEVLIRVRAAGICATDLEIFHGELTYFRTGLARFPIIPGHEWAGEVAALGSAVRGFAVGDLVTGECGTGCRACAICLRGHYHLCPDRQETGILRRDGGFAELLAMPAVFVHRVGQGIALEAAALIEPSAVAAGAARRAGIGPLDAVAVLGAGPIGLLTAQMAAIRGARTVILLDTREERLTLGRALGASHTLDPRDGQVREAVRDLAGQDGCDVVIDATGNPAALELALELTAPAGRIGAVGICGGRRVSLDIDRLVTRDISLIGSLGSPHMWPSTIALLGDGRLRTAPLITHRFPLDRIREALALVEHPTSDVVKVVILP